VSLAEPSRVRRQLGAELRKLRSLAGLSQRVLVEALVSSQAGVSRIEHGETLPTREQVIAWLRTCGVAADQDVRDRVLGLADAAHGETRPWGDMVPVDVSHLQGVASEREQSATLIRNCQLTWLPGLLQTAEYARLVIEQTDPESERDTAAALAARLQRQQILFEKGRRFEFLIAESALLWAPEPGVVDAQRDRLLSLATRPTVEVAVLPVLRTGTPAWHSFIIFQAADESSFVTTELVHGGQEIADPEVVRRYVSLWDRLWRTAVTGDQALDFIRGEGIARARRSPERRGNESG
jgi:transcriptional regulator with XRE-family HTH domain